MTKEIKCPCGKMSMHHKCMTKHVKKCKEKFNIQSEYFTSQSRCVKPFGHKGKHESVIKW